MKVRITKIGQHGAWLARLADPAGINERFAPPPYDAGDADALDQLLELAARHNIRPALIRNIKRQITADESRLLSGTAKATDTAIRALTEKLETLRMLDFGRAALLGAQAERIMADINAAALPATIVKGSDFAERAYGGLDLRTFTDIDLLVRPDAEDALGEILCAHGFTAIPPRAKKLEHTERQWIKEEKFGGQLLLEVHTDLVHAPELRSSQSLTYDLYADPAAGGISPAARLILAALHGATSHLFGRLQYVVDGLAVARMGVDADEMIERAHRSQATLALVTMLRLASEIFAEEACRKLQAALPLNGLAKLEDRLITPEMVIAAKDANRWRLLPQRYAYRWLLTRGY